MLRKRFSVLSVMCERREVFRTTALSCNDSRLVMVMGLLVAMVL